MYKSILVFCFILPFKKVLSQDSNHLSAFNFLEGVWKMGSGSNSFFEQWRRMGVNELAGMSYKIQGTDTIVFERVRITGSGKEINYLAKLKNQNQGKEIPFRLISDKDHTFIRETCFLQTKCSKKLSRTIPPEAEGILARSLL